MIYACINYVISDPYFWPSMAFTTLVGIFIGAVVYDGLLHEVKKMLLSLTVYAFIILTVNLGRALPDVYAIEESFKPLAPSVTIVLVTVFYLLGMYLGVKIVNKVRQK